MIGQYGLVNPGGPKAIARHEVLCTLEDVVKQTARLFGVENPNDCGKTSDCL